MSLCTSRLTATPYAGVSSGILLQSVSRPEFDANSPMGRRHPVLETQRILHRNHGILRAFRDQCTRLPAASDVSGLTWLEQQGSTSTTIHG